MVAVSTSTALLDLINFKIDHAAPYTIGKAALKTSIAKLYAEYDNVDTLFMSISVKQIRTLLQIKNIRLQLLK
jgi:hypothetical protein